MRDTNLSADGDSPAQTPLAFDGDRLVRLATELRQHAEQFPGGDVRYLLIEERFLLAHYDVEKKAHANNRGYDYVGPIIYDSPFHYYQWDQVNNEVALHYKGFIEGSLTVGTHYSIRNDGSIRSRVQPLSGEEESIRHQAISAARKAFPNGTMSASRSSIGKALQQREACPT